MSKRAERKEKAESLLLDGVRRVARSGDGLREYLRFRAQFHQYSFNNTAMIMMQIPDARYVMGYRQWQKVGRQVRKGESGSLIFVPYFGKATEKDAEKQGVEVGDRILKGFGTGYVWDIAQTDEREDFDGEVMRLEDLVRVPYVDGDDFDDLFDDLVSVARRWGLEVTEQQDGWIIPNRRTELPSGSINFSRQEIALNDSLSVNHRAKTLAHELAHFRLHADKDLSWFQENKRRAEIQAEAAAFIICHRAGLDTSGYSFEYVAEYAGMHDVDDAETVVDTVSREIGAIDRAAQDIWSALEETAEAKEENEAKKETATQEKPTRDTVTQDTETEEGIKDRQMNECGAARPGREPNGQTPSTEVPSTAEPSTQERSTATP